MTILDEMQLLVSDLEAAFSRRIETEKERQETAAKDAQYRIDTEKERQETAAKDAQYRAMGVRELRAAGARDARERLAEISRRSSEIAFMVDGFFRDRTAQAAIDARDRAMADRERRAEAAEESRARIAEFDELSAIWRKHIAVMAGFGAGAPRTPVRAAARPPRRRAAPKAAKAAAPKAAAPKAAAPKAAASDNAET